RVGAPLAPGARIQARAAQSRHFHREKVVARGYARAAVVDDFVRARCAEQRSELGPERLRRLEETARVEVVAVVPVLRAGDAAADGIDRLVLAAISVGRARV